MRFWSQRTPRSRRRLGRSAYCKSVTIGTWSCTMCWKRPTAKGVPPSMPSRMSEPTIESFEGSAHSRPWTRVALRAVVRAAALVHGVQEATEVPARRGRRRSAARVCAPALGALSDAGEASTRPSRMSIGAFKSRPTKGVQRCGRLLSMESSQCARPSTVRDQTLPRCIPPHAAPAGSTARRRP